MKPAVADKEALRQQMLLRALWRDARPAVVAGWLREDARRFAQGLQAYQAHAGATAERTLAAAYPTLQELLGEASFAALARDCWRQHPPAQGDLALWGAALADVIAAAESLREEPYLADVARLEWALHQAQAAADDVTDASGLDRLGSDDPATFTLRLRAGTALISSPHPIVTLWQAHRSTAPERFAPVRAAFAAGLGEHALVWRDGHAPRVDGVTECAAVFTQALLRGASLAAALGDAGADFDFEAWLIDALRQGQLIALQSLTVSAEPPPT